MSREIDISNGYENLSREDLEYLLQRGRLPEEFRNLLSEAGTDTAEATQTDPADDGADEDGAGEAGTEGSATDADGNTDAEELPAYEDMSKDELLGEAADRGLGVKKSSTKAELISILEEDDAEAADSED